MALKVVYHDVAVGTRESASVTTVTQNASFSRLTTLLDDTANGCKEQTCEHNQFVLDGSCVEFDARRPHGLWSASLSEADGSFPLLPSLHVALTKPISSIGVTLRFDPAKNCFATAVSVAWYRGAVQLVRRDYYPDRAEYVCLQEVDNYDGVAVTFHTLNYGHAFLKFEKLIFGMRREFGPDELEVGGVVVNKGMDGSCRTVYIDSAKVNVNTADQVPFRFSTEQELSVLWNDNEVGHFYVTEAVEELGVAHKKYAIDAVDALGVLDSRPEFMGGIYFGTYARDVLADIVGGLFHIEATDDILHAPLHGWIPICKRRDALALVCCALGVYPDASRGSTVRIIRPSPDAAATVLSDRTYTGGKKSLQKPKDGIVFTQHTYTEDAGAQETLFKEQFVGQRTVKFDGPVYNITVYNGTIVEQGTNFVTLTGDPVRDTIINGMKYTHSEKAISCPPDLSVDADVEEVKQQTLASDIEGLMERLYGYYRATASFEGGYLYAFEGVGQTTSLGGAVGVMERLALQFGTTNIRATGSVIGRTST